MLLLCAILVFAVDKDEVKRLDDDSDLWSILNRSFTWSNVKAQNQDTDNTNLRILGVGVGEDQFDVAKSKLGKSVAVERGEAATWRHQVCYVAEGKRNTFLIFERGEIDYSLYLFKGSATWNGSERCVTSELLSSRLKTDSGLQLGQTPAEIKAILGQPTAALADRLIYSHEIRKPTPEEQLSKLRQQNPEMTEAEFRENFRFCDVVVYIEARFIDSRLDYFVVSREQTY